MNVTVPIPDDLANRLSADGDDLSRRALEGLAWKNTKPAVSPGLNSGGCLVSKRAMSWMVF
jgi:hypothetical protein